MFTGIVEELGQVVSVEEQGDAIRLTVRGPVVVEDANPGDSICVSGCCLTVAALEGTTFTADVMRETLTRTSLGVLGPGSQVNLERAVTPATRLGGHLVQGHVDATARIVGREPSEHWELVDVSLPEGLAPYLVEKGSVTVDGVSLTVVGVDDEQQTFRVSLIPETLARTTLGLKAAGDPVNLEVDVIAKYVERMLGLRASNAPATGSGAEEEQG
jgi:riboflavin synthase